MTVVGELPVLDDPSTMNYVHVHVPVHDHVPVHVPVHLPKLSHNPSRRFYQEAGVELNRQGDDGDRFGVVPEDGDVGDRFGVVLDCRTRRFRTRFSGKFSFLMTLIPLRCLWTDWAESRGSAADER